MKASYYPIAYWRRCISIHVTSVLIALSEIAAFKRTIVQPRVSTELVQRFVDSILNWITTTFSVAAVAEIAQRIIQALLPLLGRG